MRNSLKAISKLVSKRWIQQTFELRRTLFTYFFLIFFILFFLDYLFYLLTQEMLVQYLLYNFSLLYISYFCIVTIILLVIFIFSKRVIALTAATYGYHLIFFILLMFCGIIYFYYLTFYFIYNYEYYSQINQVASEVFKSITTPLILIGVSGVIPLMLNTLFRREEHIKEKKLKDLLRYFNLLKNHQVVCGFGELGRITIEELIKRRKLPIKNLYWEKTVQLYINLIVVEVDEEKIPFVVGNHPAVGKIGYVEVGKEKVHVPVMVGDIRSKAVQEILNLDSAQTITSAITDFEANLAIADHVVETGEKERKSFPGVVLPCTWHAQREILEEKLGSNGYQNYEILHINEHIGFVLSSLAKAKIANNSHPRILVCGSYFFYYFLEGLLMHKVVPLPIPSAMLGDRGILFLKNIVVFDQTIADDQYFRIENEEELDGLTKICFAHNPHIMRQLYNKGNIGIWRGAFSLMEKITEKAEYLNKVIAVPVVKEDPYQFLINFMKFWNPNLIVFLYKSQVHMITGLKVVEWCLRWKLLDSRPDSRPEIIVAAPNSDIQKEVLQLLKDKPFELFHGVYSPYENCGRELALLENMIFDLTKE